MAAGDLWSTCPVIQRAWWEARQTTASAMSSGSPTLPIGTISVA
ncbi:hypothetical protein FHR84_004003 [Actinopolyspora biskrensis]|uniref:Uncharacterized protein n=1 Tax=Actinopolyspora biskrensis TaxID=1470178 RepID=A0A852ZD64_9ACTN|nr:hypothetical protein [Actinopolyspora biskrensis]NYH80637.1 hypothetical protein [Actinopolyspora biskrensis]